MALRWQPRVATGDWRACRCESATWDYAHRGAALITRCALDGLVIFHPMAHLLDLDEHDPVPVITLESRRTA